MLSFHRRPPHRRSYPSPQGPLHDHSSTPRALKSIPKREEKPLPIPKPEPELKLSERRYPWYKRRLLDADNTSRYTSPQPFVFPRTDFALSTSGSSKAGLNLFGGLVHDRAKNDVYSISVNDRSVTRLYTIGDMPPPRFGQKSAFAGSVVVVWGGDTMSASSNQLRASAKYDNGLYFLNLGTFQLEFHPCVDGTRHSDSILRISFSRLVPHHSRWAITSGSDWALACHDWSQDLHFRWRGKRGILQRFVVFRPQFS